MTKSNKTIFAGMIMMAVLLSTSVIYNTAFAQEFDRERQLSERPINIGTFLAGSGAAVSEDNHAWRTHFKMGLVESQTDDNGHSEYNVKRGVFIVGKPDQRQIFSIVSDTWQVSVSPNEKSFDASGRVENQEGKIFDVEISGDEISDLENGSLYYVTGKAVGPDGEMFDLFYISALIDRTSIQTTTSGIE